MLFSRFPRPEHTLVLRALWSPGPAPGGRPTCGWYLETEPVRAPPPRAIRLTGAHLPCGGAVLRELTSRLPAAAV
ncbi:hypothetical protein [Nonomuraea endophytica]|uniref:hypothetical protein n=1 Tax=Nonomuraea endophytica TaxID=714136 RepID=UPI0037C5AB4D